MDKPELRKLVEEFCHENPLSCGNHGEPEIRFTLTTAEEWELVWGEIAEGFLRHKNLDNLEWVFEEDKGIYVHGERRTNRAILREKEGAKIIHQLLD